MFSRLRSPLATLGFILALALAFLPDPARAGDVPSSVSGTYAGSGVTAGWSCEIRAYTVTAPGNGDTSRAISSVCDTPAGTKSGAITTGNACPTELTQPPLVAAGATCGPAPFFCVLPGTTKLSIVSYSPATANCALGEIGVQLTMVGADGPAAPGIPFGAVSRMCRTQIVVPTAGYPGCGASPPTRLKPRPPRGL